MFADSQRELALIDDGHSVIDVFVNDHDITDLGRGERIADVIDRIGIIPQDVDLFPFYLAHDSLNPISLQPDARTDGIDLIVSGGHCDF